MLELAIRCEQEAANASPYCAALLVEAAAALRASASAASTKREEIARKLAEWIGYSWDGLHEHSTVDRGFPEWSTRGNYQGGKADMLRMADALSFHVPACQSCKRLLAVTSITGTHGLCCECVSGGFPLFTTPSPAMKAAAMQCNQPHLGLATTRELLDELRARFEVHAAGGLDYRTVDGEAIAEKVPTTAMKAVEERFIGGTAFCGHGVMAVLCDKCVIESLRAQLATAENNVKTWIETANIAGGVIRDLKMQAEIDKDALATARKALEPFAQIALCQDFDPAAADMLDMPDFAIVPNDVRIARAALTNSSES